MRTSIPLVSGLALLVGKVGQAVLACRAPANTAGAASSDSKDAEVVALRSRQRV